MDKLKSLLVWGAVAIVGAIALAALALGRGEPPCQRDFPAVT